MTTQCFQQFMPPNLVFEVSDCRFFFFENPGKRLGNRSKLSSERATTNSSEIMNESFAFSGRAGAQKCFKPRGSAAGCCDFFPHLFSAILVFPGKKSSGFDASSGKKSDACGVVSGDCKKKGSLKSLLKHLHIGHGSKSLVSRYIVANIWVEP